MTTSRTARISIEYNGEVEVITTITKTTPSSRDSSSASSMEGHASDAYAILLLHQREKEQRVTTTSIESPTYTTATATRGRSQSDSVTLTPSWTTLTPTSSTSSSSQLPPPPKSFSSSCSRRSAPAIPALILPKTPPVTASTLTPHHHHHHPSTPLTALSVGDASPGILTPGLIQLRRSFPLPPSSLHSHKGNNGEGIAIEDIKTPTLSTLSSSNMAIEEPPYFTSYKLPGAFTSLDSLETVVPRSEDGVEQGQQQSLPFVDTPSTPLHNTHDMQGTPSCSDVFSSPDGCASSSLYASPTPQFKRGLSGKERMDADTPTTNRSKRLKNKKSKASIRSYCSVEQQDVYLNDWISHEFNEATTPTHHSHHKTLHSSPSQSSLKQRQRDIEDKNQSISGQAAAGATTRSTSRSSWRRRYSSPSSKSNSKFVHERFEERRPETAMSSFTTMTYHTISAETVYEDARDYQSGEEADLEDDDDIEAADLSVSHHSSLSITGLAISTSSSNSSISTITGAATSASPPRYNEQKRNSNHNSSRFRLSFQRRRAMSPSDSQFLNNPVFRPNSSLSLLSNQSSSQGSNTISAGNHVPTTIGGRINGSMLLARRDSTPRSSPENGHSSMHGNDANLNGNVPAIGTGDEKKHSLMSLENRRHSYLSSHGNYSTSYRQHRRAGSSISSSSSSNEHDLKMDSSKTGSRNIERPLSSSLRPLMLTPEKTRRGSLKDWSILVYNQPATHGSAFIEDFEDIPASVANASSGLQEERQEGKPLDNPYAEIYQELAKSPELEELDDDAQSPLSPLCSPSEASSATSSTHSTSPAGLVVNALRITHALEPVAEESFIESDRDVSREIFAHEASERGEASTSSNSISVLAIITDTPQPVSAGRQSTESRRRRISKATSVNTGSICVGRDINVDDARCRTLSTTSSALSRPTTYTSASGNTANSLEDATVEYGQRSSWQALNSETMQLKSPREETEYDMHLKHFFQEEEEEEEDSLAQARQKLRGGSLPPTPDESSEQAITLGKQHGLFTRQRTKSQPAKLRHIIPPQEKEEQRYSDLVKELLPLDAALRKQTKPTHRKVTKKSSKPVGPSESGTDGKKDDRHLSLFLLSALKKRKLATEPPVSQGIEGGPSRKANTQEVSQALIKGKKMISAPIQARHICTGALNSIPDRESPFGRRPSSPVKGYIDVAFAQSQADSRGIIKHPLFINFNDLASKDGGEPASATASPVTNSASDRSSPSYKSQISDSISTSPALFSSPLSSTSSHSEGPSTPRAFSPYIVSSTSCTTNPESQSDHSMEGSTQCQPVDFWAVSFEEAQAGEGDFIAPHATLVKGGKLAMLSTNEKARRRASRASLRS